MIYENITAYSDGMYCCSSEVFEQIKLMEESAWNALSALRAGDNPPQMTEQQFRENCRLVAIQQLKKGLEAI